jgi:hypothetical protein
MGGVAAAFSAPSVTALTRRAASPAVRVRSSDSAPAPRSGEGGPPAAGGWWKGGKMA